MTTFDALRRGIHELNRRKRLWLVLYAATTIWALAIVAPVMTLLLASLGESAWAERMAGSFNLEWVAEILLGGNSLAFTPLIPVGIAVFAVAAIAHLFLLGGAIQLFCARSEFSLAAFFEGCGKHFWRFVRLALVSALFYVAVGAVNAGLGALGHKIWGEGSEYTPLAYWSWFSTAIVLALFGLVNLIFDYARIRLVATDSRKAFRGAMSAVRFVFRNFRRTAGLYVTVWVILVAVLAAYRGLAGVMVQSSVGLVIALLLVRQVTVLARIWSQLLFFSSGAEMYLALAPVVVEAAPVQAPVVEEEAVVEVGPVEAGESRGEEVPSQEPETAAAAAVAPEGQESDKKVL